MPEQRQNLAGRNRQRHAGDHRFSAAAGGEVVQLPQRQIALIQEKSIIRDLLHHAGVALWFPS